MRTAIAHHGRKHTVDGASAPRTVNQRRHHPLIKMSFRPATNRAPTTSKIAPQIGPNNARSVRQSISGKDIQHQTAGLVAGELKWRSCRCPFISADTGEDKKRSAASRVYVHQRTLTPAAKPRQVPCLNHKIGIKSTIPHHEFTNMATSRMRNSRGLGDAHHQRVLEYQTNSGGNQKQG